MCVYTCSCQNTCAGGQKTTGGSQFSPTMCIPRANSGGQGRH